MIVEGSLDSLDSSYIALVTRVGEVPDPFNPSSHFFATAYPFWFIYTKMGKSQTSDLSIVRLS